MNCVRVMVMLGVIRNQTMWTDKRKPKFYRSVNEYLDNNDIPLMTFDELYAIFEGGKIEDENDRLIVEKILDAERDWIIWIDSLNDFLVVLEKEIDGETTKDNLEALLKYYNKDVLKNAWEAETVCYLLNIFPLTDKPNLRRLFCEISEKLKTIPNKS